ncbi:hypothetical protein BMS3Bbin15_00161 [archaeon BMS3Bbin15]|nr:hypothetical protein BMS3Bbin15_00161 [archaeon BMS3Bbin15]
MKVKGALQGGHDANGCQDAPAGGKGEDTMKTYFIRYGLAGQDSLKEGQKEEIQSIAREFNGRLIRKIRGNVPEEDLERTVDEMYEDGRRELMDDGREFFDDAHFRQQEEQGIAFLGETLATRKAAGEMVREYVVALSRVVPGLWWLDHNGSALTFLTDGLEYRLADCRSANSCRAFLEDVLEVGWDIPAIVSSITLPLPRKTAAALVELLKGDGDVIPGMAAFILRDLHPEGVVEPLKEMALDTSLPDRPRMLAISTLMVWGIVLPGDVFQTFKEDPLTTLDRDLTELVRNMEDPESFPAMHDAIESTPKDILPKFILSLLEKSDVHALSFMEYLYMSGSDEMKEAIKEAAASHPGLAEAMESWEKGVIEAIETFQHLTDLLLEELESAPLTRKTEGMKKRKVSLDRGQTNLMDFSAAGEAEPELPENPAAVPLESLVYPDRTPVNASKMDEYSNIYLTIESTVMERRKARPSLKDRNVLSALRKLKKGFEGHKENSLEAKIAKNLKIMLALRREDGEEDYTMGEINSCINSLIKIVKNHVSPSGMGYLHWIEAFFEDRLPVMEKEMR